MRTNQRRPQMAGWPDCDGRNLRRTILRSTAGLLILTQGLGLLLTFKLAAHELTGVSATSEASFYFDQLVPLLCLLAIAGGILVLLGRPAIGGGGALLAALGLLSAGGLFILPGAVLALIVAAPSHPVWLYRSGLALLGAGAGVLALRFWQPSLWQRLYEELGQLFSFISVTQPVPGEVICALSLVVLGLFLLLWSRKLKTEQPGRFTSVSS